MKRNPYEVLGIPESASIEELKNAYIYLARKFEEDKYADPPLCDIAKQKLEELNWAYDEIIRLRSSNSSYYASGNQYQSYGSNNQYTDIYRLLDEGKYYEAESRLDAIPEYLRDAEWYYLRGKTYYFLGWYDSAENAYKTAHKKDKSNPKYKEAYESMRGSRDIPYKESDSSSCDAGDLCCSLLCADCCCECMGDDLIPCC